MVELKNKEIMKLQNNNKLKKRILNFIFIAACLLAACLLAACSPSLSNSVDMSNERFLQNVSNPPQQASYLISVETLADFRADQALILKGPNKSQLTGDAGILVEREIRSALSNRGFRVTPDAPLILTGAVKKWQANVSSGLPAKVESEADLLIEVLSPANKLIYKANYNGLASESHPSLNEQDFKNSLSRAMSEALAQLFEDKELLSLLKTF